MGLLVRYISRFCTVSNQRSKSVAQVSLTVVTTRAVSLFRTFAVPIERAANTHASCPQRRKRPRRGPRLSSSMIYDANYVDAFETMALADDISSTSPRDIMHDEVVDAGPFLTPEEATEQFLVMINSQPVVPTMRTAAETAEIGTSESVAAADESRPTDPTPGTGAALEQPADGLSQEQLQQRASRMFCGGRGQLVVSGGATLVTEVTLELIWPSPARVTVACTRRWQPLSAVPYPVGAAESGH